MSELVFTTGLADRFEEYPKLRELIRLKVMACTATVIYIHLLRAFKRQCKVCERLSLLAHPVQLI